MKLPFIELDSVWHMGDPATLGSRPTTRVWRKSWDYEFGLFSVSLEPEVWRKGWAGPSGEAYEIRASERLLRFVDADLVLSALRMDIEAAALSLDLIERSSGAYLPTAGLYAALGLADGSQLALTGRSFEDQVLQASLGVLASADQSIDGLWWSDTLCGEMRSERGGIYQQRLSSMSVARGVTVPAFISPVASWSESDILD